MRVGVGKLPILNSQTMEDLEKDHEHLLASEQGEIREEMDKFKNNILMEIVFSMKCPGNSSRKKNFFLMLLRKFLGETLILNGTEYPEITGP
ncbi:Synaptonemal complex protein 3 [Manis javanica]|nr:Synaptonemal complex protein 3 [Manis javanica]